MFFILVICFVLPIWLSLRFLQLCLNIRALNSHWKMYKCWHNCIMLCTFLILCYIWICIKNILFCYWIEFIFAYALRWNSDMKTKLFFSLTLKCQNHNMYNSQFVHKTFILQNGKQNKFMKFSCSLFQRKKVEKC